MPILARKIKLSETSFERGYAGDGQALQVFFNRKMVLESSPQKLILSILWCIIKIMNECIFCKIIKEEIPSDKVYQNENFFVFLDKFPVAKGHTLIIPKHHVEWMQEASNQTIADLFVLVKKFMLKIKTALGCDYVQISVSGKDVPHLHIHLIPRSYNDGMKLNWPKVKYKEGETIKLIEKLKKPIK